MKKIVDLLNYYDQVKGIDFFFFCHLVLNFLKADMNWQCFFHID